MQRIGEKTFVFIDSSGARETEHAGNRTGEVIRKSFVEIDIRERKLRDFFNSAAFLGEAARLK